MLCVDDDTRAAKRVADRVYFMDQGVIKWHGPIADAIKDDEAIAKKFLGSDREDPHGSHPFAS